MVAAGLKARSSAALTASIFACVCANCWRRVVSAASSMR